VVLSFVWVSAPWMASSAAPASVAPPFQVHTHMLRHACGYALANAGHDTRAIQDWLGHRSIQHTVRYTELAPTRFKDFWRD
jgi:site-specific recombinase XerD